MYPVLNLIITCEIKMSFLDTGNESNNLDVTACT